MTPAPLQFPLDGFSDQVGALLAVLKRLVDPSQRALGKPSRHLFVVDLFSAHALKYMISSNLTSPPRM